MVNVPLLFTGTGGPNANRIARLTGNTWSPMGSGMNATVHALTVFDDDGNGSNPQALYAAGEFTTAGGTPANRIAKWNGASWEALGDGLNYVVFALAVHDDGTGPALCAGGWFTIAGNASAFSIAKWDGRTWSAVGSGVDGLIYALASFDDGSGNGSNLFAGGDFSVAGGVSAIDIARWDGQQWSALGSGMAGVAVPSGDPNSFVNTLAVYSPSRAEPPSLYVGGHFVLAGGVGSVSIARWSCVRPTSCAADITGDGNVNVADLLAVINNWGPCAECPADITGDGTVNVADLLAVINSWGACP